MPEGHLAPGRAGCRPTLVVAATCHTEIRRDHKSGGWRWTLLDMEEVIDSDIRAKWMDAQADAHAAKVAYVKRLSRPRTTNSWRDAHDRKTASDPTYLKDT